MWPAAGIPCGGAPAVHAVDGPSYAAVRAGTGGASSP
jgi:hypothetical protein